jgi:colanic acid biosynthesis glycosyl transferase WcaI
MGKNRKRAYRIFYHRRVNILLVTIAYPPELRTISSMMRQLAHGLKDRGHRVTVLTAWPQYNLAATDRNEVIKEVTDEDGVRVIRVRTMKAHKTGYIWRGIAQLLMPWSFQSALHRHGDARYDAVIVYSSYLSLARIGAWIKKRDRARYVLNLQDIFPQNAIDLDILKNKLLIWWYERVERDTYARADIITTHTENGRQFLIQEKGIAPARLHCVSNWIDVSLFKHAERDGSYRSQYEISDDDLVLCFPGVFGPTQHVNFLLDVATRVQDISALRFLLVGDGTDKAAILKRIKDEKMTNVRVAPFVSAEEYPKLLKECDIGLLCLRHDSKTPAVPGKLYSFLASGLPVLAFVNRESETRRIMRAAECGVVAGSDDADAAAVLVRKFVSDRAALEGYGQRGYTYAETHFSVDAAVHALESFVL